MTQHQATNTKKKQLTILHVLSQRPGRTGSGVTLEALVRGCASSNYEQHVIVGTDASDPTPAVADLPSSQVHPLVFDTATPPLNFALPGMSDVMPYKSTVFSKMTPSQLETYETAWKNHLERVLEKVQPDLIHGHHVWILSSLLKDIVPDDIPVITHCHATGLRQMNLCAPQLAQRVAKGCARNDKFVVLHAGHEQELKQKLSIDSNKITVVGAGFNHTVFDAKGRNTTTDDDEIRLLYAGKFAASKGLPQLLDAVERLHKKHPTLVLHVAGSGAGDQAEALKQRMEALTNVVKLHGQVDPSTLASLMKTCHVFCLPSFYEGLPLVLVEAAASGCRLVATNLAGIQQQLAEPLKDVLELVELPRLETIDQPLAEDVPAFVDRLTTALERAMTQPAVNADEVADKVAPFTWTAVYQRIETVWQEAIAEAEGVKEKDDKHL